MRMIEILSLEEPIPMILFCPICQTRHIDEGEWGTADRAHRKHLCAHCKHAWKPASVSTVGVHELPLSSPTNDDDLNLLEEEQSYFKFRLKMLGAVSGPREHNIQDYVRKVLSYVGYAITTRRSLSDFVARYVKQGS